jgi:hypothetical protein
MGTLAHLPLTIVFREELGDRWPLVVALASLGLFLAGGDAKAGPISLPGFGPGVVTDFDNLPFGAGLNSAPFVTDGHTIDTDNGNFVYGSNPVCDVRCVGTTGDLNEFDITLAAPVLRAGVDVGIPLSFTATVEFLDASDVLLGSINLSGAGQQLFAGWEADSGLIARIRVIDTASNGSTTLIDNLRVVPEPTSGLLLGFGLAGLGACRRRLH